jgi:membrane fusion protein (multidrug efflux system)
MPWPPLRDRGETVRPLRSQYTVFAFCILSFACLTSACTTEAEKNAAAPASAVQVGAENVVRVTTDTIIVGPIISGELKAEREANVRAQLGGSMAEVAVQEGQAVRRGALLGRIGAPQLEDARQSAASSVRSAENQLAVARREAERSQQLVNAGAVAPRDLDVAQQNVSNAEAQVADARARLVNAEKQIADAVLYSPLAGLVSKKSVSTGDVVMPGSELFTVIDPSSMRLEASVPSDNLSELRIGAVVNFMVRGYDQAFEGRITRIVPQADPNTRQVPIFVSIPNSSGRLVAGLFAEGRVVSKSSSGLVVPVNAVNMTTGAPWVLRVKDGKTERVNVSLGLRDDRTERVQLTAGVEAGDVLLRGAAQGIAPGTAVDVRAGSTE